MGTVNVDNFVPIQLVTDKQSVAQKEELHLEKKKKKKNMYKSVLSSGQKKKKNFKDDILIKSSSM